MWDPEQVADRGCQEGRPIRGAQAKQLLKVPINTDDSGFNAAERSCWSSQCVCSALTADITLVKAKLDLPANAAVYAVYASWSREPASSLN